MVRTYSINALTQSSESTINKNSNKRREYWSEQQREIDRPTLNDHRYNAPSPPEDPSPHQYQSRRNTDQLPPLAATSIPPRFPPYDMPNFVHSPYVDPIGSIVGLRVVYSEGKIAYVPVEPHINYLINQKFGNSPTLSPLQEIYQAPNNYINQQAFPSFMHPMQLQQQYQEPAQMCHPPYQKFQPPLQPPQQQQRQESNNSMGNLPNRVETPQNQPEMMPKHNTRRRSDDMGDFWFPNNPQPRSGVRRSKEWRNEVDTEYNPWGRGGGGSPLRDSMGNLVTDRRVLGRSWSTMLSTNLPHSLERRSAPYSLSSTYNTSNYGDYVNSRMPSFAPMSVSTSMPNLNKGPISDADQHRLELQRQIEDNKRRKEIEKQREKEQEEREQRRHEDYMAKVRREEEEERRKQKERSMLAERRSQQIAYEQQEKARLAKRQRSPPPQEYAQRPSRLESPASREMEWWEKKPTWQQKQDEERKSAVIPTLRGKPPRTPSAPRSQSRHSVQRYDPTSSIQEHEEEQRHREDSAKMSKPMSRRTSQNMSTDLNESFRIMAVTQDMLLDEQERVHHSIQNNDYGSNVFNDQHGRPTAFAIQ